MKALRAELQQPEAYLRETLEKVAILAKSGRFATQWSLKPENKTYVAEGNETSAPADVDAEDTDTGMDGMDDKEDEENDEDIKFEDALPS
jgi:transcription initiation factor TFIIF subunit beta